MAIARESHVFFNISIWRFRNEMVVRQLRFKTGEVIELKENHLLNEIAIMVSKLISHVLIAVNSILA